MPQQSQTRVPIPIVGQAYRESAIDLDNQSCKNFYLVEDPEGKTQTALLPMPGLTTFTTLGNGPVRGLFENNGNCYAVSGNTFYTVARNGTATSVGTLSTSTGPIWFAANTSGGSPTQIAVCDGSTVYVYTISTNTLAVVSDTNLQGASTLAFFTGFAVVSVPNKNLGQVGVAEDFTNWTVAGEGNLFSADNLQNKLVAIKEHKLELYLFDNKGAEVWVPDSDDSLPIQRRDDVFITQGCAAPASIVSLDNTIYWLSQTQYGSGLAVYAYFDITQQKISTPAFEIATQSYARVDDAIAYGFTWKGNLFYVITFPTADVTWVYNIATKSWFQWLSAHPGVDLAATTLQGRHLSNCYCFAFGQHLVGDYSSGRVYFLDDENFTDNNNTIIRERTCRHLFENNKMVFITNFEVIIDAGLGSTSGQGSDPRIMLQISNDGGYSWGPELWRSAGKQGQYRYRAVWKRLGGAIDWCFRIRVSDPYNAVILGATADVELGDT